MAAATPLEQTKTDGAILPEGDRDRKALASLKARAALSGHTLHELAGGELLLCWRGLSKSLPDLYAANRFLDLVTGRRA